MLSLIGILLLLGGGGWLGGTRAPTFVRSSMDGWANIPSTDSISSSPPWTGPARTSIFGADYPIYPNLGFDAEHRHGLSRWRRLNATVDQTDDEGQLVHRGAKCFESFECSWYYHTRYPGHFGDCEGGQCVCEPGYFGDHCEKAPPAPAFSCASGTCYNAKTNGRASEERGGNLTVTAVMAKNLQDLDGFGAFGGDTDAYVRIRIANVERTSSTVRNSLNPVWDPADPGINMSMGVHRAGTKMIIEVWDGDSGLEFGDDLIANVTNYVIPCSIIDSTIEPPNTFLAGEKDPIAIKSNGAIPVPWRRQIKNGFRMQATCQETAWIPLDIEAAKAAKSDGLEYCSSPNITNARCLALRMTVTAFNVEVGNANVGESSNPHGITPSEVYK